MVSFQLVSCSCHITEVNCYYSLIWALILLSFGGFSDTNDIFLLAAKVLSSTVFFSVNFQVWFILFIVLA